MDWKDRIVLDPKILVGKPVVKRTRISVELVIDLLSSRWTYEQIVGSFPNIKSSRKHRIMTDA